MANCEFHPGAVAVLALYGKNYCQNCKQQIATAMKSVDRHVEPKECFIWFKGNKDGWAPIDGTGCAHWVAHKFGLHKGAKGAQCLAGFPYRVSDVIGGKSKVKLEDVKANDFFVTPDARHMGVVIKVEKPKKPGDPP